MKFRKAISKTIAGSCIVAATMLSLSCQPESKLTISKGGSNFEGKSNATATASTASPQISPAAEHTQWPSVTTEPQKTLEPLESFEKTAVAPVKLQPPFDSVGFLIDPYATWNPQKARIYCPLPNGSLVKVWLRWIAANGETEGIFDYFPVESSVINCKFEFSGAISPQFMFLEASFVLDDPSYPQNQDVTALFGPHGENLPSPPAFERPDGGRYLMQQWTIAFPDEQTALQSAESEWYGALGGRVLSYRWDDGVLLVNLNLDGQNNEEMSDDDFFSICAEQTTNFAKRINKSPNYESPAIAFFDDKNSLVYESGEDLVPEVTIDSHAVYITSGGAKYHEQDCKYSAGADKTLLSIAQLSGYTPCKICH